jgi:cholesterol transport system auxiliary component
MTQPHTPRRAQVQLLALCGLVLLASCGGTLWPKSPPAPARHTLDAATATTTTIAPSPGASAGPMAAASAPVLLVGRPRAAAGHDSRRMVYQRLPLELEAFAFHEWVEPPAQLLAPLLVRALQDGGGFRAVLLAPSAAAGGWLLETELIRLQQDFSSRPSQVQLTLRVVLLDGSTRQVIAWRSFDSRVAAASDDPVAGVQAAQQAVQRALSAVTAFCAEERSRAALTRGVAAGSAP